MSTAIFCGDCTMPGGFAEDFKTSKKRGISGVYVRDRLKSLVRAGRAAYVPVQRIRG